MKKILLILIVIIALVGLYVGLSFFYLPNLAHSIFENKRDSLETSIKKQIKEAWNNNDALLYFKDYGGAKYLRMDMDAVRRIDNRTDRDLPPCGLSWDLFPNGRYSKKVRTAFNSLRPGYFNDLYDLYYIQSIPWRGYFIVPNDGLNNFEVFTYTPLFVGYKKETMSLRDYRPSFDKSCKEAKEYIQEEDADNRMYYNSQNEERVNNIFNLRNDYYYFQPAKIHRTFDPNYLDDFDFAKFNFYNHNRNEFPTGTVNWIYNNFYKVYYHTEKTDIIYLAFNDTKYYQDIKTYLTNKRTICNILFSICLGLLTCIILMTFVNYKRIKKQKSTTEGNTALKVDEKTNADAIDVSKIYNKVVKLSNPELFIKPYQPEKLEKANRIYSLALNNKDNIDVLEKLLEEAIQL